MSVESKVSDEELSEFDEKSQADSILMELETQTKVEVEQLAGTMIKIVHRMKEFMTPNMLEEDGVEKLVDAVIRGVGLSMEILVRDEVDPSWRSKAIQAAFAAILEGNTDLKANSTVH